MRILTFLLFTAFIIACSDKANTAAVAAADKDTMVYGEMKKYWLVLYLRGSSDSISKEAAAKIQETHLARIDRLAKEGVIIMAGPMGDKGNIRGICIMDCKDSLEADSYIKADTAVVTGRLKYEIHPWWTAQGKYTFD